MSADAATLAFYEAQAPRYTMDSAAGPSRHLDGFLDRLEPGAQILELGCGAGRDAARMTKRGFIVDATDGASAMVHKTQERFNVPARQMRFDELDSTGQYDAVWAHACLLHVGRDALPQVLSSIGKALHPSGWHYASFKLGTGEGRDLLGRLHNFPDPEWIPRAYLEVGFSIVEAVQYPGKGADGTMRDWIALTCRMPR